MHYCHNVLIFSQGPLKLCLSYSFYGFLTETSQGVVNRRHPMFHYPSHPFHWNAFSWLRQPKGAHKILETPPLKTVFRLWTTPKHERKFIQEQDKGEAGGGALTSGIFDFIFFFKHYFFQNFQIFSNGDVIVVVVDEDDFFDQFCRRSFQNRNLKKVG